MKWQSCLDPAADELVEVSASHCGMGVNAQAFLAVADALHALPRRATRCSRTICRARRSASGSRDVNGGIEGRVRGADGGSARPDAGSSCRGNVSATHTVHHTPCHATRGSRGELPNPPLTQPPLTFAGR